MLSPKRHLAKLPIERISVVGAGGNGSIFLSHLCRIHQAWVRLGGQPFKVDIYDPDNVSVANLARQVFCDADIGKPKATVLAVRLSAFYGIKVTPHVSRFCGNAMYGGVDHVVVGCVDNLEARRAIAKLCKSHKVSRHQWGAETTHKTEGAYWLDLGNNASSGQVILGGHGLPDYFDVYPKAKRAKENRDAPSCSLAEALEKQDLFINSTVATLAGQLLWTLMRKGALTHHGYFVNLGNGKVTPLPVAA